MTDQPNTCTKCGRPSDHLQGHLTDTGDSFMQGFACACRLLSSSDPSTTAWELWESGGFCESDLYQHGIDPSDAEAIADDRRPDVLEVEQ